MASQAPLGTKDLFNTPGAHLPGYVREVARGVMQSARKKGVPMTKSRAIAIALGRIEDWKNGKGEVNADTRAKAAAAWAEWIKARALAKATPNKGSRK